MKIAIIAAMEEEVLEIEKNLLNKEEKEVNKFKFIFGKYNSHDVIIAVSGIGKVAAAMLFTTLIQNFEGIERVINVGVAGGVLGKTKVGDVVLADKINYHDVDLSAFTKYSYGELPNNPKEFETDFEIINIIKDSNILIGTISTGDKFMISKKEVSNIKKRFVKENIYAFDMESAAFAQCAYYYEIPFTCIRGISDVIGETTVSSYEYNLNIICKKIALLIIKLLEKI